MTDEYFDQDGYPTDKCLEVIAQWPIDDELGWFNFIYAVWHQTEMTWEKDDTAIDELERPVIRFCISTGGWSGNEDIIEAMQKNTVLWSWHWVQSRRGGHYIFEIKKDEM